MHKLKLLCIDEMKSEMSDDTQIKADRQMNEMQWNEGLNFDIDYFDGCR